MNFIPGVTKPRSQDDWDALAFEASQLFTPSTPISERDLFAGRSSQILKLVETISERGKHAILFGERGVGKTSLASLLSSFFPTTIRRLRPIREQADPSDGALEAFGPISRYRAAKVGKGRPDEGFWLNEQQALYVGAKSDAPNGGAVLTMLINAYTAWRRGHLPAVDQQALARQIAAIVDDKLSRSTSAMVTHMLPNAVAGYMVDHHLAVADGVTAGEVCDLSRVAESYPRGIAGRVSGRLGQFCSRNGSKPWVSRIGRVRAKVYPTALAREWLDIEGRALIRKWSAEKSGQKVLRLVGRAPGQPVS